MWSVHLETALFAALVRRNGPFSQHGPEHGPGDMIWKVR